jgi:uncharacterized protein (DUF2236 family)
LSDRSNRSDHGLFGPGSVTWRVHSSATVAMVGGLRSLLIQALHPLAMAGVAQHSNYRRDPLGRLRRTGEYVAMTIFGDVAQAEAAAARVRHVHRRVKGTDPVTGRPYSANDPEIALWVHCVEVHSFLQSHRAYSWSRLSAQDEDRYFAENVVSAELLGIPAGMVPASVEEMRSYFQDVRPQLCVSQDTRDAIEFVLQPPLSRDLLPFAVPMRVLARAAAALVPRDLRRLTGMQLSGIVNLASHTAIETAATALMFPPARELSQRMMPGPRLALAARAA